MGKLALEAKNLLVHRSLKKTVPYGPQIKMVWLWLSLAMEMYAVMGATVDRLYNNIVEGCGDPRFGRIDAPCTKVAKV